MDKAALTKAVKQRAKELGFDLVGVARAKPPDTYAQFAEWIEEDMHGEMGYMERGAKKRADVRNVLPDAKSVIVVGMNYLTTEHAESAEDDRLRGRIARYAWGEDYHDVMEDRLWQLLAFIKDASGDEVRGKVYVDTGPLLERDAAVQAGIGWFGKNTNLLNTRLGSYFFLGELIVSVELEYDKPMTKEHCGKCTRCLELCPTQAFIAPYVLDARRCISYLTIELKGSIPRELRPLIGTWVFGCDICQEVCPWNRKVPFTTEPAFQPAKDVPFPDLIELLLLTDEQFRERFRKSPIKRAKRRGLLRNVCVALGNLHDPRAVPALKKALLEESEPLIREHAAWALGRISTPEAIEALRRALESETDPKVREEIEQSLCECIRQDE